MALTQISTNGVKDNAVTSGKIPANAVGSSELADDAVDTAAIADSAVTSAKIANGVIAADKLAVNAVTTANITDAHVTTAKLANNAVNGNILADNSVSTTKIQDAAVTLAKLEHGTSSNNGKFLRANNGADPTFETVTSTNIVNNASGRLVVGSNTANTLDAKSTGTYNGTKLFLSGGSGSDGHIPMLEVKHLNTASSGGDGDGPAILLNGYYSSNEWALAKIAATNAGGAYGGGYAGSLEFWVHPANGTQTASVIKGAEIIGDNGGADLYINNGNLVIGTAGHGISFAADSNESGATGELLDDYETGTYTAHFAVEGQGNMSMSGRVGRYTRVGNVVTVMGGGRTDGVSGASSGAAIEFSNLPFPVFNTSSGFGHPFPVKLYNLDSSGLNSMSGSRPYIFKGRLFTDGTHGRIEGERSDSAQNSVNSSLCLSNTSEIHYMFTYLTDA